MFKSKEYKMTQTKSLKDINKLSDDERLIISRMRLEKAQKVKTNLQNSLKDIDDTINYLSKKIDSLNTINQENDTPIQSRQNEIRRIRRTTHDRIKVNLYLSESFRSKLNNSNNSNKPLAHWIRSCVESYVNDPEFKSLVSKYISFYENYENQLSKNKEQRKTFVVAIDRNIQNVIIELSKSYRKDDRLLIESILYQSLNENK